jgi:hypothetical protein
MALGFVAAPPLPQTPLRFCDSTKIHQSALRMLLL